MKTPLTQAQKARRSIIFGSHQGERPHSLPREVEDFRDDVEAAFVSLEGNSLTPVIQSMILDRTNFTIAGNGGADHINALTINGKNFFAGRGRASITLYGTGSLANYITLTSIVPGTSINDWTFTVQAGAGNDAPLDVAINPAKVITLKLNTDGAAAIEDAAVNNLTAIQAELAGESDVTDHFAVSAVVGDGDDIVSAAVATANFSGGEGLGLSVKMYQPGQAVKSLTIDSATDSSIVLVAAQDLAAAPTVGQSIGFVIESHTAESNRVQETVLA
jgi:hypothetical protein